MLPQAKKRSKDILFIFSSVIHLLGVVESTYMNKTLLRKHKSLLEREEYYQHAHFLLTTSHQVDHKFLSIYILNMIAHLLWLVFNDLCVSVSWLSLLHRMQWSGENKTFSHCHCTKWRFHNGYIAIICHCCHQEALSGEKWLYVLNYIINF